MQLDFMHPPAKSIKVAYNKPIFKLFFFFEKPFLRYENYFTCEATIYFEKSGQLPHSSFTRKRYYFTIIER